MNIKVLIVCWIIGIGIPHAAWAVDENAGKKEPGHEEPATSSEQTEKDQPNEADESEGSTWSSRLLNGFLSFNPDISAILDVYGHTDGSDEGIAHIHEEISGFGHVHDHEGHEHHHGVEEGFNMRHLEIQLSAEVDPYFKGDAIAAILEDGAEMEVAEIQTTCLPAGCQIKAGKFFSDFGYINGQHSHQWDFTDQPLIYQLTLGEHGLNDVGAQLSWLAPTPFYLLAGVEAMQGDNEVMFAYDGDDPLPSHDGPRVGVAWLKYGPNLPNHHGLQIGAFWATGEHQEAHDGDEDGESDHWLDGDSTFWGADVVYKCDSGEAHGQGDLTLVAEYLYRQKDMDVVQHDLCPALTGEGRSDKQDGLYVQGIYGFLPRWRAGLRWDLVGLVNESDQPDGTHEEYGTSHREGVMVDFTPSEFSRIRVQANQGSYDTAEGRQDVTEVFLQLMVSLGTHGSHKF